MPTVTDITDRATNLRVLAQTLPLIRASYHGYGKALAATRPVAYPLPADPTDAQRAERDLFLVEWLDDLHLALTAQAAWSAALARAALVERETTEAERAASAKAALDVRNMLWLLLHGPDAVMCAGHAGVPGLPAEQMPLATGPDRLCDGCRDDDAEAPPAFTTDGITVSVPYDPPAATCAAVGRALIDSPVGGVR